jgi:hypothetical protein
MQKFGSIRKIAKDPAVRALIPTAADFFYARTKSGK